HYCRRYHLDTIECLILCCCRAVPYFVIYVFFFQAEDGIRDRNVTGVQTCALPILLPLAAAETVDGGQGEQRLEDRGQARRKPAQIGRASCRERVLTYRGKSLLYEK